MKFYLHPFRDSIRCFKKKKKREKILFDGGSSSRKLSARLSPEKEEQRKESIEFSMRPIANCRSRDLFRTETKNGQTTKKSFLTISIIIQKNTVKISMLRDPNYRSNRSQKRR